jgi:hypothetical protein
MAKADQDNGTWLTLPQAASTDEGRRLLVDDIRNDRYLVRYVDEMSAISQSPGDKDRPGKLEILEWRVGRLPERFARLGKFNWEWGFVTHAGRTLQRIEIFFPAETITASEPVGPRRTGGPGRPTSIQLVIAEAVRRLADGRPCRWRKDFAGDLSRWLKKEHPLEAQMTAKTISGNADIKDLWQKAIK